MKARITIQEAIPAIVEEVWACSMCGKTSTDKAATWIGGSPFSGWFNLHEVVGGTSLHALRATSNWDFCSKRCLREYVSEKEVGK